MKKYRVTVNGTVYEIELEELTGAAPVSAPAAAPAPTAAPAGGDRPDAPPAPEHHQVPHRAGEKKTEAAAGRVG